MKMLTTAWNYDFDDDDGANRVVHPIHNPHPIDGHKGHRTPRFVVVQLPGGLVGLLGKAFANPVELERGTLG